MSMQSLDMADQSSIYLDPKRPGAGSARQKRRDDKILKTAASPYSPRQAWLSSMNQGRGFNNVSSSGYGNFDPTSPAPPKRVASPKPVSRVAQQDPEELYDEIQRLKECVAAHRKEQNLRKTQIAKLEKELSKKDKLLDDTLSQTQSSYGAMTERSTTSNSTIIGLRQKSHKLECMLRERDNEIKTLKSNIKSTRLQELEIMCDTYCQEIGRLTQVVEQRGGPQRSSTPIPEEAPAVTGPSDRERVLEGKVQQLELDNATLRKQILKGRDKPSGDTTGVLAEFAGVSRSELEEKHAAQSRELFDRNLELGELRTRCEVAEERERQARAATEKQRESLEKVVERKGAVEQKVAAISGEHEAQKLVIRRLNSTVRMHEDETEKLRKQLDKDTALFKERLSQKAHVIAELEAEIETLRKEREERKKAPVETPRVEKENVAPEKQKPEKRKKPAKTGPVKTEPVTSPPPASPTEATAEEAVKLVERKEREEREEAARRVQRCYRNHSLSRDAATLQRVLQGHTSRMGLVEREVGESATLIQTALSGYDVKRGHIERCQEAEERVLASEQRKTTLAPNASRIPETTDQKVVAGVLESTDEDDLVMM